MFDFGISDLVNSFTDFVGNVFGNNNDEEDTNLTLATEFSLSFSGDGESQTYYFALLPAVDDGNETTAIPEIKPGILKKTNMQIKRFMIPGSSSIFQMVGIRETILQCVGLLVGEEGLNNDEVNSMSIYDPSSTQDAYSSALEFDNEVVQRGSVCNLNIISRLEGGDLSGSESISIQHNCFIQNYRYFVNRSDRVWFSLELVILDYSPGGTKFIEDNEQQNQETQENDNEKDIKVNLTEEGIEIQFTEEQQEAVREDENIDVNLTEEGIKLDYSGAKQNQPVENVEDSNENNGPSGSAL